MTGQKPSNGRWFTAVVFLVGLIVGGGASSAVGHLQYKELDAKIDRLSENVARIEGHLGIKKE